MPRSSRTSRAAPPRSSSAIDAPSGRPDIERTPRPAFSWIVARRRPRRRRRIRAGRQRGSCDAGRTREAVDRAMLRAELNADPLGAAVAGAALEAASGIAAGGGAGPTTSPDLARRHDPPRRWPTLSRRWRQRGAGAGVRGRDRHRLSARAVRAPACRPRRRRGQIGFALAADADFFLTVAKLRALRRLWGRVLEVVGAEAAMPALRAPCRDRDPDAHAARSAREHPARHRGGVRGGGGRCRRASRCCRSTTPAARPRRWPAGSRATPSSSCSRRAIVGRVIDPAGGSLARRDG